MSELIETFAQNSKLGAKVYNYVFIFFNKSIILFFEKKLGYFQVVCSSNNILFNTIIL